MKKGKVEVKRKRLLTFSLENSLRKKEKNLQFFRLVRTITNREVRRGGEEKSFSINLIFQVATNFLIYRKVVPVRFLSLLSAN